MDILKATLEVLLSIKDESIVNSDDYENAVTSISNLIEDGEKK